MKRFLILAFSALAVAIAAPSAFATRAIFDPPVQPANPTPPNAIDCTAAAAIPAGCSIAKLGVPYTVGFTDCSKITGVDTGDNTWCLWMNNVSGRVASQFMFTFTIPEGGSLSGDGLECSSQNIVATSDCPSDVPDPSEPMTISFFGKFTNNTDFYLFTDFVNSPGTATVTASVPEPGELGLFGLGLIAVGVAIGWQKRRQSPGSERRA